MPAYLLRHAGTKHFAGFYAVDDEADLLDLIDEGTKPNDYEYALVLYGFWTEYRQRGMSAQYKIRKGDAEIAAILGKSSNVYITQAAYTALTSGDDLTWKRLKQD